MRCSLIAAVSWVGSCLGAQTDNYSGLSVEHEVTARWGYELAAEYRRNVGRGSDDRFLFLAAANRKLGQRLDVSPGVRVSPRHGDTRAELRLFTDVNYAQPLGDGPLTLEGRLRTQFERPLSDGPRPRKVAVRPRLGLSYGLSERLAIIAEYEARYRFDVRNELTRHRYNLVVSYDLLPSLNGEVYFRREDRTKGADPATLWVIGLFLNYTLPDRRDRDWAYRHPFGRRINW